MISFQIKLYHTQNLLLEYARHGIDFRQEIHAFIWMMQHCFQIKYEGFLASNIFRNFNVLLLGNNFKLT